MTCKVFVVVVLFGIGVFLAYDVECVRIKIKGLFSLIGEEHAERRVSTNSIQVFLMVPPQNM